MALTEKRSGVERGWDALTRPHGRVPPLQRARARALAILVLITLPVLWLVSSWAWPDTALQALRLVTPIAFVVIYIANRAGYFYAAAWLFVLVLALQPALYLVALPVATFETVTFGAMWLLAPVLVCYVLLNVRELVLTLLLVFSLISAVLMLNPAVTFSSLSISLLMLFWIAAVLLVSSVSRREDVRRQLQYADRLLESDTRYRTLFAATMDGIVVHQNGVVVDCNQAFAELVGYPPEEIIGKQALEFYAPEERERAVRWMTSTEPYQTQGVRKDGSRFWASVQGQPI